MLPVRDIDRPLPPGATIVLALVALACAACGDPPGAGGRPGASEGGEPEVRGEAAPRDGPYLRVLGTAQDGGFPHAACLCPRCETARRETARRRRVASLAIVLPDARRVFLIDATPDIRAQLEALVDVRRAPEGRVDRAPVDGIFLTHAHLGHYTGLAFLGYEAIHSRSLPVYATPRMAAYLRANDPFRQLVDLGNIATFDMIPGGEAIQLGEGVRVRAERVPHRDELSDTVAFVIEGPERRVLYLPDTEPWARWRREPEALLRSVDIALVDGTFYSSDELPGRDVSEIGHPLIESSLERLGPLAESGLDVRFTHFNHSNPVLDAGSAARETIRARGFGVLEDGDEIGL